MQSNRSTAPRVKSRLDRRRDKSRRGASAVEFAVVAPVLFVMLLGMVEFGRVLTVHHVLTLAARTGAREAVLPGASCASVQSVAQAVADSAAVPLPTVNVVCSTDPATAVPGTSVGVTVSVPMAGVSNIGKMWFPAGHQVSSTATMRKEGFE